MKGIYGLDNLPNQQKVKRDRKNESNICIFMNGGVAGMNGTVYRPVYYHSYYCNNRGCERLEDRK